MLQQDHRHSHPQVYESRAVFGVVVLIKRRDVEETRRARCRHAVGFVNVPEDVDLGLDFVHGGEQPLASGVLNGSAVEDAEWRHVGDQHIDFLRHFAPYLLIAHVCSLKGVVVADPNVRSSEYLHSLHLHEVMAKICAHRLQLLYLFLRIHPLILGHFPALTQRVVHFHGWLQSEVVVAGHDYLMLVGQPAQELSEVVKLLPRGSDGEVSSVDKDIGLRPFADINLLVLVVRV